MFIFSFFMAFHTLELVATASEFPWNGGQLQMSVGGMVPVKAKTSLSVQTTQFWAPQADLEFFYGYVGLMWTPTENLWVSPLTGVVSGWRADGRDAPIAAFWGGYSYKWGDLLMDAEIYPYGDVADYYGFYALTTNLGACGLEAHVEQVNENLFMGPGLGFANDRGMYMKLRYFAGFQDSNRGQNLRFVFGIDI